MQECERLSKRNPLDRTRRIAFYMRAVLHFQMLFALWNAFQAMKFQNFRENFIYESLIFLPWLSIRFHEKFHHHFQDVPPIINAILSSCLNESITWFSACYFQDFIFDACYRPKTIDATLFSQSTSCCIHKIVYPDQAVCESQFLIARTRSAYWVKTFVQRSRAHVWATKLSTISPKNGTTRWKLSCYFSSNIPRLPVSMKRLVIISSFSPPQQSNIFFLHLFIVYFLRQCIQKLTNVLSVHLVWIWLGRLIRHCVSCSC